MEEGYMSKTREQFIKIDSDHPLIEAIRKGTAVEVREQLELMKDEAGKPLNLNKISYGIGGPIFFTAINYGVGKAKAFVEYSKEKAKEYNIDPKEILDLNLLYGLEHTALHRVTFSRKKDIVELLLKNGADPNVPEKGYTVLHVAAEVRLLPEEALKESTDTELSAENIPTQIARLLLTYKADPNAIVDYEGEHQWENVAPIHLAAEQTNLPLVKLLVENGADASKEIINHLFGDSQNWTIDMIWGEKRAGFPQVREIVEQAQKKKAEQLSSSTSFSSSKESAVSHREEQSKHTAENFFSITLQKEGTLPKAVNNKPKPDQHYPTMQQNYPTSNNGAYSYLPKQPPKSNGLSDFSSSSSSGLISTKTNLMREEEISLPKPLSSTKEEGKSNLPLKGNQQKDNHCQGAQAKDQSQKKKLSYAQVVLQSKQRPSTHHKG
jgi:hypothetical protein